MAINRYLDEFDPGQNIIMVFDDKTAADRPLDDINQMFARVRKIISEYGFDLNMWCQSCDHSFPEATP